MAFVGVSMTLAALLEQAMLNRTWLTKLSRYEWSGVSRSITADCCHELGADDFFDDPATAGWRGAGFHLARI